MIDRNAAPPPEPDAIDDAELSAYLDGELEGEARRRVAETLEASPETARRGRAFGQVDQAIGRYADAVAAAALPSRLCIRRMAAERRARRARRLGLASAVLALVFAGFAGGWLGHGMFHRQTFATRAFLEEAQAAHHVFVVEIRHPVEVARSEESHLVGWLSKRLDNPLSAPSLDSQGFRLVGGRLLPTRRGAPAAQLMYEDTSGRRVTFYAARNAGGDPAAFRFFKAEYADAETAYWVDPRMRYALTGAVDRETLLLLANAIAKGLDRT